jgi:hypothetical protein
MNKKDRKQRKKKQRQERIRRQKHLRHFGGDSVVEPDREYPYGEGVDAADTDELFPGLRDAADSDPQFERIDAILGDSQERGMHAALEVYYQYLNKSLILPCEVTGTEDFRWEEYYIIGPGSKAEHTRLRKRQPSYLDHYQLVRIEFDESSEWMLFPGEDIAAHVIRMSDNKPFVLGLAELKAVDRKSPNYQLLDDFAVFLVNYR